MSDLPHNVNYRSSNPINFHNSQDRSYNRNYGIQNSQNFPNSSNETCKGPYFPAATNAVGSVSNQFPSPVCSESRTSVSSAFTTGLNQQFLRQQAQGNINVPPQPLRPPFEMPCNSSASSCLPSIAKHSTVNMGCTELRPSPQVVRNSNMQFPQQQNISFPPTAHINNQPYVCSSESPMHQALTPTVPQHVTFQQFPMPPPPIMHTSTLTYGATSQREVPQHPGNLQNHSSQVNSNFVPQSSADYRSLSSPVANAMHTPPGMLAPPRFANTFSFVPPALCTVSMPITPAVVCSNNASTSIAKGNSPSVNTVNSLHTGQTMHQHSSSVIPSSTSTLTIPQEILKPPPPLQNCLPPFAGNPPSETIFSYVTPPKKDETEALKNLLENFKGRVTGTAPIKKDFMSVAEYVSLVKSVQCLLEELSNKKSELKNIVHCDTKIWDYKVKSIVKQQNMLCDMFNKLTDSRQMEIIISKLQKIRKKRSHIKRLKEQSALKENVKIQQRENLHREIDRWHEVLREKDEQQKRDAEMKKEADYILSEVRKKIQEAKRAIEKLKMLEKLRHTRKENSLKKGMLFLPSQDRSFEAKVSEMKELMQKQLTDYEAEERALKVMLETEQEGQREMEAEWRLKKLKALQEKKHNEIMSSLFGESEPPNPEDPLFLFHQYYESGSKSIDCLIQIRHAWDIYLVTRDSTDGSSIPERWVVPNPPSDEIWHTALVTNTK